MICELLLKAKQQHLSLQTPAVSRQFPVVGNMQRSGTAVPTHGVARFSTMLLSAPCHYCPSALAALWRWEDITASLKAPSPCVFISMPQAEDRLTSGTIQPAPQCSCVCH